MRGWPDARGEVLLAHDGPTCLDEGSQQLEGPAPHPQRLSLVKEHPFCRAQFERAEQDCLCIRDVSEARVRQACHGPWQAGALSAACSRSAHELSAGRICGQRLNLSE